MYNYLKLHVYSINRYNSNTVSYFSSLNYNNLYTYTLTFSCMGAVTGAQVFLSSDYCFRLHFKVQLIRYSLNS